MSSNYPKKLIEVSIPLKEINEACAREKSIRHGHPSTLHLWWARRPLAAARAVLFCQLVDDPSGYVDELMADKGMTKATEQELLMEPEGNADLSPRLQERLIEKERERLHDLVRKMVVWENTTNERLLKQAHKEIEQSWQRYLRRENKPLDTPMPPVLDPFAGGGAIPLEAQRLGMEAHASDLNPVAVLINKAMIEIPPKFAGNPPVHPEWQGKTKEEKAATTWKGTQGLAEDVRYYGNWMREEARKRIGHLYPPYVLTQDLLDARPDLQQAGYKMGDELTVIAWLWARTVPSPNPALQGKPVPLVSSFWLSKKKGKEAYVEPVVENGDYHFTVRVGKPANVQEVNSGTKTGKASFRCIVSGVPLSMAYLRDQGSSGSLGEIPFAIVCDGKRGRVFLPASPAVATPVMPEYSPPDGLGENLNHEPRAISTPVYGLTTYSHLFTERQKCALSIFTALVDEARLKVKKDCKLEDYSDAVAVYLGLAASRLSDSSSSLASWTSQRETFRNTFGRQALQIVWDFAEANVLSNSAGNFNGMVGWVAKVIEMLPANGDARVDQANASTRAVEQGTILSSDPPYYDNIGYADLSDFFYVWLRQSLRNIFPQLFAGILVPKKEELIAAPYRIGGRKEAEEFFLQGMTAVAHRWAAASSDVFPLTLYYAFKQSEKTTDGVSSTGWATFLGSLLKAGLAVIGTWPLRTERPGRVREVGSAALASSIVLVCRQRAVAAETITKREFIEALESELPDALNELQHANLSPVDLPQSAIGPGMAIFSRYAKVVKGDGQPMNVTEALQLINHELSHLLDGQVSDMDPHTRFACKWFAQHGFQTAAYGEAELIANATNVAVDGVVHAGILESEGGKVRILKPVELPSSWHPATDSHLTIWEVVHHIIRLVDTGGDQDCAKILAALSHSQAAEARQLAYRLFTLCDQNKWSELAQPYNQLVTNWQDYTDLAAKIPAAAARPVQSDLNL